MGDRENTILIMLRLIETGKMVRESTYSHEVRQAVDEMVRDIEKELVGLIKL